MINYSRAVLVLSVNLVGCTQVPVKVIGWYPDDHAWGVQVIGLSRSLFSTLVSVRQTPAPGR